ncbi:dnaJ homolog subfamily C member 4 isoform X2 [Lemur catta]|uniref:dnaJ homolog subfamily C member 4 isoform X2 n=1 Tax=Lemur catta TaxID=9447 RepID=UPI001E26CFE5|nr:dnaJ homolog subfamily C member 4 isoform X2 [Lemur catta]
MPPLRLCRLWPRNPPTRLLGEAAGQRSSPSNYYELLGVHPGASTEEVKRAFFTKSKELHPDRDPGNPTLHSRFVELSEAYHVLSHEQSRRSYDHQLSSASPPKSRGNTAHPKSAHQTHSSWAPPNAQYWAQFHGVRPQGPESRQQQHKLNQRVVGYCLLLMLAGMGLHYVAFRCIPVLPWGDGPRVGGWVNPSLVRHLSTALYGLHSCVSQAKNCMKSVSGASPYSVKAAPHEGLMLSFSVFHHLNVNLCCWLPENAAANQNHVQEANVLELGLSSNRLHSFGSLPTTLSPHP